MANLNVLIIEDNDKHMNDAKVAASKAIAAGLISHADFATTYVEAETLLLNNKYDRIISDVFFPYDDTENSGFPKGWDVGAKNICWDVVREGYTNLLKGGREDEMSDGWLKAVDDWTCGSEMHPTGILLAQKAMQMEIPIVFCSDGYHHGFKLELVNQWFRKNGLKLVDVCKYIDGERYGHYSNHADTKDWEEAINYVIR